MYIYLYVYRLNDFLRFSFDLNSDDMEHVPSTLISELKEYVNNDLLSDVSFIVEGKNNDRWMIDEWKDNDRWMINEW